MEKKERTKAGKNQIKVLLSTRYTENGTNYSKCKWAFVDKNEEMEQLQAQAESYRKLALKYQNAKQHLLFKAKQLAKAKALELKENEGWK